MNASSDLEVGPLNNHNITFQNTQFVLSTTEYIISFETTSEIPAGGRIEFQFPSNRIWKNGAASIVVNSGSDFSNTVTGTNISFDSTDKFVSQITLTSFCTSACGVASYTFKFSSGISNLDYIETLSGNFVTYTTDSSGSVINRDIVSNADVDPILASLLTSVSITKSNNTLGASTSLTVSFTTNNPFPDAVKIILYMPTDQISLDASTDCFQTSAMTTVLTCSTTTSGSNHIITIDEWCTSGGTD